MASTGDQLSEAIDLAEQSAAEIREAEDIIGDILAAMRAAFEGSSDANADEGLAALGEVQSQLTGALVAISSGIDLLQEYAELLPKSKGPAPGAVPAPEPGVSAGGGETPGAGPASTGPVAGPHPLPDFNSRRAHPQAREAIRRVGWPRNSRGDIAARGLLYDRTGQPLLGGKTLPASASGPGSDTSDLKEPWRSDDRYTTRFHVEGHTAAFMRRNGITEAVLYLNIAPCGNRGPVEPDPIRCEANLAAHLPEGSVLYVHSVHENGTTRSKAYTGTGEALQ